MQLVSTPAALKSAVEKLRAEGLRPALVPTMGALHDGHASLMRTAARDGHAAVVSIFVNPTQFGPNEDFARYPRLPEADAALCEREGVAILYMPEADAIYPEGFATTIHIRGISDYLCGPHRPGHFDGVATVVAKLLLQAGCDAAYFGEKDWQQLQVVTRLARDLDLATRIIGVPTVREADGLALSSRNRYLDAAAREQAVFIPRMLQKLAAEIAAKPATAPALLAAARRDFAQAGFRLDYLEWADAATCAPAVTGRPSRLFVAAWLGATRLIDNWPVAQ